MYASGSNEMKNRHKTKKVLPVVFQYIVIIFQVAKTEALLLVNTNFSMARTSN